MRNSYSKKAREFIRGKVPQDKMLLLTFDAMPKETRIKALAAQARKMNIRICSFRVRGQKENSALDVFVREHTKRGQWIEMTDALIKEMNRQEAVAINRERERQVSPEKRDLGSRRRRAAESLLGEYMAKKMGRVYRVRKTSYGRFMFAFKDCDTLHAMMDCGRSNVCLLFVAPASVVDLNGLITFVEEEYAQLVSQRTDARRS